MHLISVTDVTIYCYLEKILDNNKKDAFQPLSEVHSLQITI